MKKVLSALLVSLFSFGFVGCGNTQTDYNEMQREIKGNGFDISIEDDYVDFENEDGEGMSICISEEEKKAPPCAISSEQELYFFRYNIEKEEAFPIVAADNEEQEKSEKKQVKQHIEDLVDAIGYSVIDIIDFANWYCGENK